jgi:hypothetical protein
VQSRASRHVSFVRAIALSFLLASTVVVSPLVAARGVGLTRAQDAAPIVRVFLLAGQSNMEGHGVYDLDHPRDANGGRGSLATFLGTEAGRAEFADLTVPGAPERLRDDVFVTFQRDDALRSGPLGVGFGAYEGRHHFGPELGIGRVLGQQFDEPVLLVKTAWGGKSLVGDFRPPSAGGVTGAYYERMLRELDRALAGMAEDHPQLAGHTAQLDGIVWFQGWNDACDDAAAREYEANLVALIRDLRSVLGDAALPFVVGETGNYDDLPVREAQRVACGRPEVGSAARFVPTRRFLHEPDVCPHPTHGHHWYGNGESYLRIGDALGRAVVDLVAEREVRVHDSRGLAGALAAAGAGRRILLAAGEYEGVHLGDVHGAAGAPVVVRSSDPTRPARFAGGVQISRLSHVVLADVVIEGSRINGLNLDDGGVREVPSHHIELRRVVVRDAGGGGGNLDGIKLSGLTDFRLIQCTVERWGDGGSAIDMVGCHRGTLERCRIIGRTDVASSSGVQIKGGSSAIQVLGCHFVNPGQRALNVGGSTGLQYFRPPVTPREGAELSEARDVLVEGNVIEGAEACVAFVGVDGATVRWNTFVRPKKWALRILQENHAPGFVPVRNGVVTDNLVLYRSDEMRTAVNVGPHTAAETFTFARNVWRCEDDPRHAAPALPAPETDGVGGGAAEAARGAAGADAWPKRHGKSSDR